jgi:hypothetical protein
MPVECPPVPRIACEWSVYKRPVPASLSLFILFSFLLASACAALELPACAGPVVMELLSGPISLQVKNRVRSQLRKTAQGATEELGAHLCDPSHERAEVLCDSNSSDDDLVCQRAILGLSYRCRLPRRSMRLDYIRSSERRCSRALGD